MGTDLILLPFDGDIDELAFSHTILPLERRIELFKEIDKLAQIKGVPVPKDFNSYLSREPIEIQSSPVDIETTHYGRTMNDSYDATLLYVKVSELMSPSIIYHQGVKDNWKNRAVWGFLRELPPNTKIALYWS